MRALRFRVARWLRARVGLVVVLTILVALVTAVVLALGAGARRTATAPDRFTDAYGDGAAASALQDDGRPRDTEIAALPGVRAVESMSFVFGGITRPETGEFLDTLVFAGSYHAASARLVDGRAPDPARREEFVATTDFVESSGLAIGGRAGLLALSQVDAAEHGFEPAYAEPVLDGVLVGVIESAASLDDPSSIVIFSPALIDDQALGISGTVMTIALDDGVGLPALRAGIATLPRPEQISVSEARLVSSDSRTAVRAHSIGLLLLAAIGGIAAVAALAQLLVRTVRLAPGEVSTLGSLGYTRAQLVGESTARATLPVVVVGVTVGVGIAIAASGLFPFGFVRRLEPDQGVRVEVIPLLVGWFALVAGIAASVAVATRSRSNRRASRRPTTVDALAARCPTPAMATGVRFAFGSGTRSSSHAAASLIGAVLVAGALVGTLTFAVSTQRLVNSPERYGRTADFVIDNGAAQVPPTLLDELTTHPDVAGVTLYTSTSATVGDSTIVVAGMDPVRGAVLPYVLSGELPTRPGDAAIGRRSARELDLRVGDTITVSVGATTATYEITGIAIPPDIRGNDEVGHGVVLTDEGFDALAPAIVPATAAVDLRQGASPDTAARLMGAAGITLDGSEQIRPPSILNAARITFVPFVLAILLASLAGLVVVNMLFTGVRRREGQLAVLRALGADRRFLVRSVVWQAVLSTTLPLLIGVPVGLVAGRYAYVAFATHLATATDIAVPAGYVATSFVAIVLIAVVVALVASRPSWRDAPATMLRTA